MCQLGTRLLADGERVANTTLMDSLLDKDFQLTINDAVYNVRSPEKGTDPSQEIRVPFRVSNIRLGPRHGSFCPSVSACTSHEHAMGLADMKHMVHLLHTALHMPEHHLLKERQLLERMDTLKQELSPLEEVADVSENVLSVSLSVFFSALSGQRSLSSQSW